MDLKLQNMNRNTTYLLYKQKKKKNKQTNKQTNKQKQKQKLKQKQKQKTDEISIFGIFLAKEKKKSMLAYILVKRTVLGRPWFIKILGRHTLTNFHDFDINGKKRPYSILWVPKNYTLGVNFKFTGGGRRVTKKPQEEEG